MQITIIMTVIVFGNFGDVGEPDIGLPAKYGDAEAIVEPDLNPVREVADAGDQNRRAFV